MSRTVTLPSTVKLDDLAAGPAEGWGWESRGDALTVTSAAPIRTIEPVGLAVNHGLGSHGAAPEPP